MPTSDHEPDPLDSIPVPCPPCLRQLLREQISEPHPCNTISYISLDGGHLMMGSAKACPCPCPCQARAVESEALKAARAEARGQLPDSPRPPRTP